MIRIRAVALLISVVALPLAAQITPTVSCWTEDTASGMTTVVFGYSMTGASDLTYPIGADNVVWPSAVYWSQPTTFTPGTHSDVFMVTVSTASESSVSWTVAGQSVTFDRNSFPRCTYCICSPGDQGATGATGPQGSAGIQGPTGSDGLTGDTGPAGPVGAAGPAGPDGVQGPQGDQGDAGPAGATGAVGRQGPAGDAGAVGARGPDGPAGPAGSKGDTGDAGPQGPQGDRGATGPQGSAGAPGPDGMQGERGAQGAIGLRVNGELGAAGRDGATPFLAVAQIHAPDSDVVRRFDGPATMIVIGAASVRSTATVPLTVVVDGTEMRVAVAASSGGRLMTVPIMLTAIVREGEHRVRITAPDTAHVESVSASVLFVRTGEEMRRRTAPH